jgi:PAS domain S-box-containing protein
VLTLQRSGELAAQILDQVSDLFLACDSEWRLTLVNPRCAEYLAQLGTQGEKLIGRNIWDVVPGVIGSRFQAEAFRAVAQHTEVEFEAFFSPLERWLAARITPVADGVIVSARDVTGWRRTERELARETERLGLVIETQQAVATAGPDVGAVMRVVAERMQALTRAGGAGVFVPDGDELVLCQGCGLGSAWVGLRVGANSHPLGRCYGAKKLLRCDDVGWEPDIDREIAKALQLVSCVALPLSGESGVQAVVAVWSGRARAFDDVHEQTLRLVGGLLAAAIERAQGFAANQLLLSERTAALAALRAGEERFRTLVESLDDVVYRMDREQRCIDIFGRWLEREGFAAEQFLGRTTREIVGAADAPLHERANLRALAGETVSYEWVFQGRRGLRQMQTTLSPLRGAGGEVTGIVGVGRDITQRIEAEQQIRMAQKMEAVGRFAGGVAHDLNNMMMIILGFSDFLLTTLDQADPRRGDADEIRKAAERAMHLTRQLLGLGRQRLVARQVVSLNDVVSGMERMLRPLLGEDIALVTHLADGLGGVEADYGQMEQVVMNLALNARDAMRGGGRLVVRTADVDLAEGQSAQQRGIAIPAGSYVLMTVSDSGHGMSPEVKAHLFEPFFTTKPTTHNSGLGLTTVYGIVVQSGGYIAVESEPQAGTTFRFYFPRVMPEDSDPSRAESLPSPVGGSETILLVEDEDAVRVLASRALASQGYVVLEARNGWEALALAERTAAALDLVLTDVVMPEMGGLELVQRLTLAFPALRVMYMSGYSEADKLQPGIQDSDVPFLPKPFSAESLLLRVRAALDATRR